MPWLSHPDYPELPFRGESGTSKAGAQFAQPKAGTQTAIVIEALSAPATLHELVSLTGLPLATVCARVGALKKAGQVEVVGTKKSRFGVANQVYQRV